VELDAIFLCMPTYTTQIPSLGLVSLISYLEGKGFKTAGFDFSQDFYKKKSTNSELKII
jgi:hypothetical protein